MPQLFARLLVVHETHHRPAVFWRLRPIDEAGSRSGATKVGGVTLQIVRDWVVRFNASGPNGLMDRKSPGAPSRLGSSERQALMD